MLTKPIEGIQLLLYFAVTDNAICSVLMQQNARTQHIIYFYSQALQGAKKRYQRIQKTALAVLMTTRKLRAYFQSFKVRVKTDLPLKQILQRPDMAGRMVSWSIEL